jgi:hypothetical protein
MLLSCFVDMKRIIEVDPSNEQAKRSLFRLEPLAAEKREKMKEEMMGNVLSHFPLRYFENVFRVHDFTVVRICRHLIIWTQVSMFIQHLT